MGKGVECESSRRIQGQVLRRTARREVAIFLYNDTMWIADFIDGEGELVDAATWFRFNCAGASGSEAQRRMFLESATPLSADLTARIEMLLPWARPEHQDPRR